MENPREICITFHIYIVITPEILAYTWVAWSEHSDTRTYLSRLIPLRWRCHWFPDSCMRTRASHRWMKAPPIRLAVLPHSRHMQTNCQAGADKWTSLLGIGLFLSLLVSGMFREERAGGSCLQCSMTRSLCIGREEEEPFQDRSILGIDTCFGNWISGLSSRASLG